MADFPLRKRKITQKNMGLKHWILPNNHFKTHLFFPIFGWGGDPFQLRSWSEGWLKHKSSLEKASDKCQKTFFTDLTKRFGDNPWVMAKRYDGFVV